MEMFSFAPKDRKKNMKFTEYIFWGPTVSEGGNRTATLDREWNVALAK